MANLHFLRRGFEGERLRQSFVHGLIIPSRRTVVSDSVWNLRYLVTKGIPDILLFLLSCFEREAF